MNSGVPKNNVIDLSAYRQRRAKEFTPSVTSTHPIISDELDPYNERPRLSPERQAIIDEFSEGMAVVDSDLAVENGGKLLRLVENSNPPDEVA